MKIEGVIVGFDEYMNIVLDNAEEVYVKSGSRSGVGETSFLCLFLIEHSYLLIFTRRENFAERRLYYFNPKSESLTLTCPLIRLPKYYSSVRIILVTTVSVKSRRNLLPNDAPYFCAFSFQ